MQLIGQRLVLAVSRSAGQSQTDTTARVQVDGRFMHRHHGWRGVVAGVIWLGVVIYVLWLATRVVRAVERVADKFPGRGP